MRMREQERRLLGGLRVASWGHARTRPSHGEKQWESNQAPATFLPPSLSFHSFTGRQRNAYYHAVLSVFLLPPPYIATPPPLHLARVTWLLPLALLLTSAHHHLRCPKPATMSASPEFFKAAGAPAFSPACAAQPPLPLVFGDDYDYDYDCRTPTGSRISYLREPTTCPPAPKKPPPPPPCRKRLFQAQPLAPGDQHQHQRQRQHAAESSSVPLISLRLDELERLFRPHPPPAITTDKRRRSSSVSASANKHCAA